MFPTLVQGETRLFKRVDENRISRGDIVLVEFDYGGEPFMGVFRVIGLPGEQIEISNEEIVINGKPIDFKSIHPENVQLEEGFLEILPMFKSINLSEGEWFILGDNIGSSLDSRIVGPLKEKNIVGELLPWIGEQQKLKTNFWGN